MPTPAPASLIAGHSRRGGRRALQPVINPATGEAIAQLTHALPADLDEAVETARKALPVWSQMSPDRRGAILTQASFRLRARAGELATLISLEVGKPIAQSTWEVAVAADTLQWFAEEGRRAYGRIIPGQWEGVGFRTLRQPVGVVVALATWNFPVINAARKIGAALAAGCTCVYKPDEEAPSCGLAVAQALHDAGLPAQVLSVVFGDPAAVSAHLLDAPGVRKLSFTGSVPVGRHLGRLAAERGIRTTMELGGHAPVVVCQDADIQAAVRLTVASKFRNSGQVCVAPTRFLVHRSVFSEFTQRFAQAAGDLRLGPGVNPLTEMGPLIHERRRKAVDGLVKDAVAKGASVLTGAEVSQGPGFFYPPTVLAQVPLAARIMNEEPFGPVALIQPFAELEEAVEEANRLSVGLAAYVFSQSLRATRLLTERIEAGMVAVNTTLIARVESPFLGLKDSGHGAENGVEGLEPYLTTKSIAEAA